MWRSAKLVMAGSMIGLIAVGSAWAQAPAPGSPTSPAPSTAQASSSMEGKVKKVDLTAGTVRVATGWFGLFSRTLSVTGETQVQVEGRQGTLADVAEGSQVKASYELRDGRNVATHIDVMPPAQSKTPAAKASQQ